MLAPLLPLRWHTTTFVLGPALLAVGLAGTALSLSSAPLPLVAVWLTLVGVAFGICNMYINQAILAHAQKGQEDATSGAIPTLQGLGGAERFVRVVVACRHRGVSVQPCAAPVPVMADRPARAR